MEDSFTALMTQPYSIHFRALSETTCVYLGTAVWNVSGKQSRVWACGTAV